MRPNTETPSFKPLTKAELQTLIDCFFSKAAEINESLAMSDLILATKNTTTAIGPNCAEAGVTAAMVGHQSAKQNERRLLIAIIAKIKQEIMAHHQSEELVGLTPTTRLKQAISALELKYLESLQVIQQCLQNNNEENKQQFIKEFWLTSDPVFLNQQNVYNNILLENTTIVAEKIKEKIITNKPDAYHTVPAYTATTTAMIDTISHLKNSEPYRCVLDINQTLHLLETYKAIFTQYIESRPKKQISTTKLRRRGDTKQEQLEKLNQLIDQCNGLKNNSLTLEPKLEETILTDSARSLLLRFENPNGASARHMRAKDNLRVVHGQKLTAVDVREQSKILCRAIYKRLSKKNHLEINFNRLAQLQLYLDCNTAEVPPRSSTEISGTAIIGAAPKTHPYITKAKEKLKNLNNLIEKLQSPTTQRRKGNPHHPKVENALETLYSLAHRLKVRIQEFEFKLAFERDTSSQTTAFESIFAEIDKRLYYKTNTNKARFTGNTHIPRQPDGIEKDSKPNPSNQSVGKASVI